MQTKTLRTANKQQIRKLLKLSKNSFDDFEITRLEYDRESKSLEVYAESEWLTHDDEGNDETLKLEDLIATLYAKGYRDECEFSRGFVVENNDYAQWLLWCGFIEPIDFDKT